MKTAVRPISAESGPHALSGAQLTRFQQEGYAGPFRLFDPPEAHRALATIRSHPRGLIPWVKGGHAVIREMYEIGARADLVHRTRSILGDDILLWGSLLIRQKPKGRHEWHLDLEYSHWDGVTIWLALQNVGRDSGMSVITRTHRMALTPQSLHASTGLDEGDDEMVLAAARRIDAQSELVHLPMRDGDFVIMHGRIWHATHNRTKDARAALILQYAPTDSRVRIPKSYESINPAWRKSRPPCVLVHGKDEYGFNRLVDPARIGCFADRANGVPLYFPKYCFRTLTMRLAKKWHARRKRAAAA